MAFWRGYLPKITWGTGLANTLTFGQALDQARSWAKPKDDSDHLQLESGIEMAWVAGYDYGLEGQVRHIPITDQASPVVATGWDGATGWEAFLEWAWLKNQFRFYPDAAGGTFWPMYLVEPFKEFGDTLEQNRRYRQLRLLMRTADNSVVTGY